MVSLFLLLGCNLSYIVDLFAALHELASASAHVTKARIIGAHALKTLWTYLKGDILWYFDFSKKVVRFVLAAMLEGII